MTAGLKKAQVSEKRQASQQEDADSQLPLDKGGTDKAAWAAAKKAKKQQDLHKKQLQLQQEEAEERALLEFTGRWQPAVLAKVNKEKKKQGPKQKLLKLVRRNQAALQQLSLLQTASDSKILEALWNTKDLDVLLRDGDCSDEWIDLVMSLLKECRRENVAKGNRAVRRVWLMAIYLEMLLIVVAGVLAMVAFVTSLGKEQAVCSFAEFANRTCNHGNECYLQVKVLWNGKYLLAPGSQAKTKGFKPPVTRKKRFDEMPDALVFDENGPFRCCNTAVEEIDGEVLAGVAQDNDTVSEDSLMTVTGSGTPCCSFFRQSLQSFCDNFGIFAGYEQCPRAPWKCAVTPMKDEFGRPEIGDVSVYEEPHTMYYLQVGGGLIGALICTACLKLVAQDKSEQPLLDIRSFFRPRASPSSARTMSLQQFVSKLSGRLRGQPLEESSEKESPEEEKREQRIRTSFRSSKQSDLQREQASKDGKKDKSDKGINNEAEDGGWYAGGDSDSDVSDYDEEWSEQASKLDTEEKVDVKELTPAHVPAKKEEWKVEDPARESRPATSTVAHMLRPIVTPVVGIRQNKNSQKPGLEETAMKGFAATYTSGFGGSFSRGSSKTAGAGWDRDPSKTYSAGWSRDPSKTHSGGWSRDPSKTNSDGWSRHASKTSLPFHEFAASTTPWEHNSRVHPEADRDKSRKAKAIGRSAWDAKGVRRPVAPRQAWNHESAQAPKGSPSGFELQTSEIGLRMQVIG
eukprot:TRINITY_DN4815_c0_g1_i2.p1 TRINITY_DN4815_c0_g1~~TRINITY_DN4815_c0_g1_i2.p1  ORF type:complete len:740 (+),score=135.94 TRINITY_DN4815_c0_g1_i2:88-2307(+)